MTGDLVAHAMRIAEELGASVFPVIVYADPKHPGKTIKQPMVKGWSNGAAVMNAQGIEELFAAYPTATHVGIQTGRRSRLLVVDLDGEAALQWWSNHRDALPPTYTVRTRRENGRHLYYTLPVGVELRNSAGKIADGVDIRASGGFVVDWTSETGPATEDIADAPQALIDLVRSAGRQPLQKAAAGLNGARTVQKIGVGARHDALKSAAASLRRKGLTGSILKAALDAWYDEHCEPPINHKEIAEIADYFSQKEGDEPITPNAPVITDSDIANAKRLAEQHGRDLRFTPERGWLAWDGRRWAVDDKELAVQARAKETALSVFDEIKNAVDRDERMRHAKKAQSKVAIEAMIWLTRSEPGVPVKLTDFDADPWLLNVANGTLDLKTGNLLPHTREHSISNLTDVTFDPTADCELWDAFMWRVTDHNDELYAYLRRFVGYLLVGDTTEQCLHFLYGLGANGKSVFCEVLMRLLGQYAVAASPDLIMLKRHGGIPNDVARLRGVRAALMNETTQGARFDEAKLKDLTGGDTLTARFLHKEFFDFSPTHRIVIRGNHKPAISGTDEGIWRRLRLVPFTVSIPPHEQDRDLLRKLSGELPGILNWALVGCRDWQAIGLKPPPIIADAVRQYREESDTLGRFIAERCMPRALAQEKSSTLFKQYQEFAQSAGERWIPSKDLPHEMQRRGFGWKRTKAGGIYEGIELICLGADIHSGDGW